MSGVRSVREMLRETIEFRASMGLPRRPGHCSDRVIWPKPPTSAGMARDRLRWAVKHDREAVPCGRWVPRVKGEFYPGYIGRLPFRVKPKWAWEARR